MPTLCQHTLIELHGCDPATLKRAQSVGARVRAAVRSAGATIVRTLFHTFSPHGVSGVVVITESHVTIHTWPEHGYAAVDVFSCDTTLNHATIREQLRRTFRARRVQSKSLRRGVIPTRPGARRGHPARRRSTTRGANRRIKT
jgi:S-adenosylmethionine decarboxylase proenzyme